MENKRGAIIELYRAGKTPPEISKLLQNSDVNRMLIQRTIKRYNETKSIEDRKRCGRPRSVTTPAMVKKVKLRITRNPNRSMRKMAKEMKVSEGSIRNIVKNELELKSLKRHHAHQLTVQTKKLRLQRCKAMLQRFTQSETENILFSYEKIFTIEAVSNRQNDRILAPNVGSIADEVRIIPHSRRPKSVMVWAGISTHGRTKLIFVPDGVKINSQTYQDLILEPVVKKAGQSMFHGGSWTFQQDSAPAHSSKATQAWLRGNIPDFISKDEWPPCSPDLNPMDFSVWGILESKVGANSHKTIEGLQKVLLREWKKIPQSYLCAAVHDFYRRLKACISKKGGYFE